MCRRVRPRQNHKVMHKLKNLICLESVWNVFRKKIQIQLQPSGSKVEEKVKNFFHK